MSPEAILHASAGVVGLVSGATALIAVKGGRPHRVSGTVFFVAMMGTAASGAWMGFARGEMGNAIAGVVTLYLLATAWMVVKRPPGQTGVFELGAFLLSAAAGVAGFYVAIAAMRGGDALLGGVPYLIIASIVSLAAVLDLSVLVRRGVSGRQRIARHLWRMTLGFAAAVGSFFPGQLEIFPAWIRETKPFILLFLPFFVVIGLMIFWLVRVLFTRWKPAHG